MAGVNISLAFCLCHRHLSLSTSAGPFTHCLSCLCKSDCGRLRRLCVVSCRFLQGCAVGMFGRARVCVGGFSAGRAQSFFVLRWPRVWLCLVCYGGFPLVWLLSRVRCQAWCWGLLSVPVPRLWAAWWVSGLVLPAVVYCVSCFDPVCCC